MRSLELAREEVLHLVRKPIMVAAFIVMMVIPLLYGALYLWAFWDPYGSLDRIPVAVVNLDQAAEADGETINAGADLVDKLLDRGTFDWRVVSDEEAQRGVRDGRYYSSLTIPKDFSATLAKADSDSPARARLLVVVHESKNMIAAQIEGKVFDEVRKATSADASKGYFDTIFVSLDEIHVALDEAADGSATLADALDDAADGSARLESGAVDARRGGEELSAGLDRLSVGAGKLAAGSATAASGTGVLAEGAATLSKGTGALSAGASRLATGATSLAAGLSAAQRATASLAVSAHTLADGAAQVDAGMASAENGIGKAAEGAQGLEAGASSVTELLAGLSTKYPEAAADPLFKQTVATAGAVASGSASLADSLSTAKADTSALAAGAHKVSAGSGQLAGGADKLAAANAQLLSGAEAVAAGAGDINSGSTSLSQGALALDAGAQNAAAGVTKLAAGNASLANHLADADSGSVALAEGLADLHDGTSALAEGLSTAASGSHELASGLKNGAEDVPAYSAAERTARAEMMSDPVRLDEAKLGHVKTYGTGFAPYFVPLALWVGMLIVFVLLAPIPKRAAQSGASAPVIAMTGMWPAMVVGLGQSLLMFAVLRFGLHLTPVDPFATFGVILLTAVVFAALMQWLSTAFGSLGKLIGIVILMLQLTSAAGTFPIETLPAFFRYLSPWLPMTHAVAALRESVSGGDAAVIARQAWLLALFGAAAFVGTVFSARNARLWSDKRLKPTIEL